MRGSEWGIYLAVLVVGFTLFGWLEATLTGEAFIFSTPITIAVCVWGGSLLYHLSLISGQIQAPQVLGYQDNKLLDKCANILLIIVFISFGVKVWLS